MTDYTYTAQERDGVWTVDDSRGGTWWPSEDAIDLIDRSSDPEGLAISLASEGVRFGEWRS